MVPRPNVKQKDCLEGSQMDSLLISLPLQVVQGADSFLAGVEAEGVAAGLGARPCSSSSVGRGSAQPTGSVGRVSGGSGMGQCSVTRDVQNEPKNTQIGQDLGGLQAIYLFYL